MPAISGSSSSACVCACKRICNPIGLCSSSQYPSASIISSGTGSSAFSFTPGSAAFSPRPAVESAALIAAICTGSHTNANGACTR